ncbi:DEKNAAC105280 [Brettanomyces naardenensis]|uniref:DEKNAAC105280 n=1 Tax=Brettanomyces naardenensis TaxID=13370 RepID=A0A448YT29_BRENA|nr:DEKNAAC105280 [Brettanomyces naardenensis]
MSNQRLDSISRPSHKLKFKPKLVARKPKEEREAHISTPGIRRNHLSQPRRFVPNKDRFNKRYQNTTLLSAGPLSAGAVSVGSNDGSFNQSRTVSPVSDLVVKLRRLDDEKRPKVEGTGLSKLAGNEQEEDDDDDDERTDSDLRIDMGQKLEFDSEDLELFPVRADRVQHYEYGQEPHPDDTIKTEFHRDTSIISSGEGSREASNTPDVKVKEEDGAQALIPGRQQGKNAAVDAINDYQSIQETRRLREDYESLVKYMERVSVLGKEEVKKEEPVKEGAEGETDQSAPVLPSKYLFLQLPSTLPTFDNQPKSSSSLPKGIIGKLRYHKSGKLTMKIGNVVFDITRGGSTEFEQEIIAVNRSDRQCYHLGSVGEKMIATPKLL